MSKVLRERRKRDGYCAVTVIGAEGDPNVWRLQASENPERLAGELQPGNWRPLRVVRTVWTPGLNAARTIIVGAEKFLTDTGHCLFNHWYRCGLDVIDDLIRAQAVALRAATWTDAELAARLQQHMNAEADRFAQGVL